MSGYNYSTSRRKFLKGAGAALAGITIIPRHVLGGTKYTSPNDKINLGFIGVGKQGIGLGTRFMELEEVQITAGCDVDRKKLMRFEKKVNKSYAKTRGKSSYDGIQTFGNFLELIEEKDIDAIVIATPDHWHALQAIIAMKAGKDVYCEKPLAHTIEEGRAMVTTARETKKILQTGSMQRSRENFRKACELVQNGYLGEIQKVLVNVGDPAIPCDLPEESTPDYLNWDSWIGPAQMRGYNPIICPPIKDDRWADWRDYEEFGGGILSDWGAHMFDIAQWGLGMDMSGPTRFVPPKDPTAKRGLVMHYENGAEMVHEDFGRGWGVRFIGSEGTLDISRQYLDSEPGKIAKTKLTPDDIKLYDSDNHYQDWLDCIHSRELPICDVEIGHRSASICNLANIAYDLGEELLWNPQKEKFEGNVNANKMRGKTYRKDWNLKKWV